MQSGRRTNLEKLVAEFNFDNRAIIGVVLADARGDAKTTAYSGNRANSINVAAREHFRVHLAHDSGKLFVGKPVVGRVSGQWTIPVTRRINKADGTFDGVAMALLEPHSFLRLSCKTQNGARSTSFRWWDWTASTARG